MDFLLKSWQMRTPVTAVASGWHWLFIAVLAIGCPLLAAASEEWVAINTVAPGIWTTNNGAEFPGAKAKLLPAVQPGDSDAAVAAVEVDLRRGGQYAGLEYPLRIAAASRLRFEVTGDGITGLSLRVRDADGQTHVTSVEVKAGVRQLIDLPLDNIGFPGHWGGRNDGTFRFPLGQLVVAADQLPDKHGKFLLYNVQLLCKNASPKPNSGDVWVQAADGLSREWRVNIGAEFPGAKACSKRGKMPSGKDAAEVEVDLRNGGRYAGLEHPLQVPSASNLQLTLFSKDAETLSIRVVDCDGQVHVTAIPVKTGIAQTIELPLDGSGFPGHWGGRNDGVFRFPLERIMIVAESLPAKHGSFQIETIRFAADKKKINPALMWKLDIESGVPGNIFFRHDRIRPEVRIANLMGGASGPTTAVWQITDQTGKTIAGGEEKIDVGAYVQTLFNPVLPSPDYGYYQLRISLRRNGKEEKTAEACFGVVEQLPNYGPKKDRESFFGLQMGDIFDPAAAARIGVKWDRPTRVWLYSDVIPVGQPSGYDRPHLAIPNRSPEENKYFWPDDTAVSEGQKYGISSMMTLHYEPNGCKPLNPGDMGFPPSANQIRQWQNFVAAAVKRYDGLVSAWEIMNEAENTTYIMKNVSLATGIKSYSALISSAREAIRKAGSRHPVVAIDIASGDNSNAEPFVNGVTAKVGNQVDVFTGHPYAYPRYFGPGKRPISPVQNHMTEKVSAGLEKMRQYGQAGKPLWIGEIGWAVDCQVPINCQYTRDFAAYVAQGLIMIHSVPGVQRCFWFIQDGCNEGGFEYGLWRGNPFAGIPLQPLPAAVAYASCARFLYHVEPIRKLELSGMHGYAFRGRQRDRAVAAIWADDEDDSTEFEVKLPSGATVHEMYGRAVGTQNIKLTAEPLFLTVPYSAAEELFAALTRVRPKSLVAVRILAAYFKSNDDLAVRLKNRLATDEKIEVSVMGQRVERLVKAHQTDTLALKLPSIPGSAPKVEVKIAGKTVELVRPPVDFASCPYRQPEFNGNLAAWGKPQAVLNSRLDILPPDLNIGWGGSDDLSAQVWWGWNEQGFCFAVRIRDDEHQIEKNLTPTRFWMGDSLQLAFDVNNDAASDDFEFSPDDREFGLAVTDDGGKVFRTVPSPDEINAPHYMKRIGNDTVYEVMIPWEQLGVGRPQPGKIMAFNFIANDNDGNGRKCWIGLRPGIGEFKRPGCFLKIRLDGKQ